MNQIIIALASVILIVAASGCQTYRPNATAGGLLGGTTGGLIGAAIGSHEGKTGEGALIGAVAGGLTGATIGNQADQENARQQQFENAQAIQARQAAVTVSEVIQMSQSGLGEEVIINQIHTNGIASRPVTDDLIQLKSAGVSDSVIQELQSGGPPVSATYPRHPNYYPANQRIYVDPHYPPVCPAPPIIYHAPRRHPPRHARHSRAGFSLQF